MTILIVTKNYPPRICGVGDHSCQLKLEWEEQGHIVFILTEENEQAIPEMNVFEVKNFGKKLLSAIRHICKNQSIDIILWQYVPYSYQQKGLPFWWPFIMLRLRFLLVKQITFFHEVSIRIWGYGVKHTLVAFLQRCIANAAALFAQSSFTSIPLFKSYFICKKPFIVPISANIQVPKLAVELKPDQVFCFANRADFALLKAIKEISINKPVKLVLGGVLKPSVKESLKHSVNELKIADLVHITGALPSAELANTIAESAIFIQPQIVERRNEGGISAKNGTVMAAMGMGKAIITCAGDMTDPAIFQTGKNILFVPYGDETSYRNTLDRLLDNPGEIQSLGLAAKETYNRLCSWRNTASAISSHF